MPREAERVDLVRFNENLRKVSPEYLAAFRGRRVAWHADGTHIVAAATSQAGLYQELERLGIDPSEVVLDYVDSADGV